MKKQIESQCSCSDIDFDNYDFGANKCPDFTPEYETIKTETYEVPKPIPYNKDYWCLRWWIITNKCKKCNNVTISTTPDR